MEQCNKNSTNQISLIVNYFIFITYLPIFFKGLRSSCLSLLITSILSLCMNFCSKIEFDLPSAIHNGKFAFEIAMIHINLAVMVLHLMNVHFMINFITHFVSICMCFVSLLNYRDCITLMIGENEQKCANVVFTNVYFALLVYISSVYVYVSCYNLYNAMKKSYNREISLGWLTIRMNSTPKTFKQIIVETVKGLWGWQFESESVTSISTSAIESQQQIEVSHQWIIMNFLDVEPKKRYIDSKEFGPSSDICFFLRLYPRGKIYPCKEDDETVSLYLYFKSAKYHKITVKFECALINKFGNEEYIRDGKFELVAGDCAGWDKWVKWRLMLNILEIFYLKDRKLNLTCKISYMENSLCVKPLIKIDH